MNRKIIGTLLSAVLLTSFVLTGFSGCKSETDGEHYTIMQWLGKVEETFNLLYYSEQEPLVKSVKASDSGFETVQIAAEWGIIDPDDDLKFGDSLTKELAADTLVRAMNCVTPSNADFSDCGKVKPLYLQNVMSSVNEGIFALDAGRFDPKKRLSAAEADSALLTAHDKWVGFSYGESFDRSVINENVINLGGVNSENSTVVPAEYSVEYTGSRSFFDENGGYTDNTGKTITFPADQIPEGLAADSVLAMPADDVVPMNYAVVVTGVKTNGDGSVTVTTRNAELQEVYDEIDIQQSGPLDFSEAIFYGPDGQRLTFAEDREPVSVSYTADNMKAKPVSLRYGSAEASGKAESLGLYRPGGHKAIKTDDAVKGSFTFKLGEIFSVKVSPSLDKNGGGLGIELKGEVKGKDEAAGEKLAVKFGIDESIKVENRLKTHWEWFQLKVDDLRFSLTETNKKTAGVECSAVANFGNTINKVNERDDGKWDIGDWSTEGHELVKIYKAAQKTDKCFKSLAKDAKSPLNKKLLDVIFPSTNIHFVIRAELTIEGSIKLTIEQSNTAGVELMNGKLRPIHEKTHTQKMDYSAKTELTGRIALEFQLIGINVADIGVKGGVGGKVSSTIYSFDKATDTLIEACGIEGAAVLPGKTINANDDVQIVETGLQISTIETRKARICTEVTVYPILSVFGCSSSSVAGKLFGSIELKVFDEKTPFFKAHCELDENGTGIVSECSITANENYGITTGDRLMLNTDKYAIKVSRDDDSEGAGSGAGAGGGGGGAYGEDADTGLRVIKIPPDVSIKDINITSDNTDVLEVENLLHKIEAELLPDAKVRSSVEVKRGLFPKLFSDEVKVEVDHSKIGSWFYDDLSGGGKPQFALTGKKNGVANVTISAGEESITVPVQVGTGADPIVSTGALIGSTGTFTLAQGQTAQATFDYIPEGKTIDDVTFASADNSVATVSEEGLISAVNVGDTDITATLKGKDKEYSATFTVHVTA